MPPHPDKAVAYKIVKSVLFSKAFIVSIAENVGKMVDRAVDKYGLRNMEEASMTVADDEP